MMEARRNAATGEWIAVAPLEAGTARPAPGGLETLTAREREVVDRAIGGSSNKSIAFDLGIADATVRVLLWRAYGKLGVRSRRELIEKAFLLTQLGAREEGSAPQLDAGPAEGLGAAASPVADC